METFTITPLRWLTNFGISKLLIGFVMKEMTLFDLRLGFGIGLYLNSYLIKIFSIWHFSRVQVHHTALLNFPAYLGGISFFRCRGLENKGVGLTLIVWLKSTDPFFLSNMGAMSPPHYFG